MSGAITAVTHEDANLDAIWRLLILYMALVLYGYGYELYYAYQLTPIYFGDALIRYDASRSLDYRLVEFLTPLALLPIGTRLRTAGQYIMGPLSVIIFIPVPIVFIPMATGERFWTIYVLFWLGILIAARCSALSFSIHIKPLSERGFKHLFYAVTTFFFVALAATTATSGISFVTFAETGSARQLSNLSALGGYAIYMFSYSFGGFIIAMAFVYRKFLIVGLAVLGFVICYGVHSIKLAALAPFWLLYIVLARKYFFRDSMVRYFIAVMAPLIILSLLTLGGLEGTRGSLLEAAFALTSFRLFTIPALGFNIYYDFFLSHPLTYWSHINIIGAFVHYPYSDSLPVIMRDTYNMGTYPAAFPMMEGLAAGGPESLPLIFAVFGFCLIGINTAMRNVPLWQLAAIMAIPSLAFIDVGLGTALVSDGIGILAITLSLAPKESLAI
jgi:hypothetical protein